VEPLPDPLTGTLAWTQPKAFHRRFELVAGDAVIAKLTFETAFGSLATGRTADGAWTLKRVGFFRPSVTVRIAGKEDNIAHYHPRWTGTEGELNFGDGRAYRWRVANFWVTRFELQNSVGEPLITFRQGSLEGGIAALLKTQALVDVTDAGRSEPDLALLAVIAWYLIVLTQEDSSAAAATAATAATT
jgi:hypothetical protein